MTQCDEKRKQDGLVSSCVDAGSFIAFESIRNRHWTISCAVVEKLLHGGRVASVRRLLYGVHSSPSTLDPSVTQADIPVEQREAGDVSAPTAEEWASAREAIQSARELVTALDETRLREFGTYITPPSSITYTFQAVLQLLELTPSSPTSWGAIKQVLRKKDFLLRLSSLDADAIAPERYKSISNDCSKMVSIAPKMSNSVMAALQRFVIAHYDYIKLKSRELSIDVSCPAKVEKSKPPQPSKSGSPYGTPESILVSSVVCVFPSLSDATAVQENINKTAISQRNSSNDTKSAMTLLNLLEEKSRCGDSSSPTGGSACNPGLRDCDVEARDEGTQRALYSLLQSVIEKKRSMHGLQDEEVAAGDEEGLCRSSSIISRIGEEVLSLCDAAQRIQGEKHQEMDMLLQTRHEVETQTAFQPETREAASSNTAISAPNILVEDVVVEYRKMRDSMALQIAELRLALEESNEHAEKNARFYEEELNRLRKRCAA